MTVEHNQFTSHDKTMLIGSSDSEPGGKLRVTLHHNLWTPALTAGLESSTNNLPTELAKTAGAGVLTGS